MLAKPISKNGGLLAAASVCLSVCVSCACLSVSVCACAESPGGGGPKGARDAAAPCAVMLGWGGARVVPLLLRCGERERDE